MRAKELAGFCLQTGILLDTGIPLSDGLSVMAEDAEKEKERDMLLSMAEDVELGEPLEEVMGSTGEFPDYLVQMAGIGNKTGNLENVMKGMAGYYRKEYEIAHTIRNTVTYPLMMITMLMVVLFLLLTKVMPVFREVYRQLGTDLSPVSRTAVQIGIWLSGLSILAVAVMAVGVLVFTFTRAKGRGKSWPERILELVEEKTSLAGAIGKRRILSVLAITERSGMNMEEGMAFAVKVLSGNHLETVLENCRQEMEAGENTYDALKRTGIFSGMDLQMIKIGNRAGKADLIFEELADKYEGEIESRLDTFITRFEPTVVITLAVVVGLILLAVMMPLVGIMASMGA